MAASPRPGDRGVTPLPPAHGGEVTSAVWPRSRYPTQAARASEDGPAHRVRSFERSRDPAFAAKLTDIVGLYLDPPAHAVAVAGRRD
jgi:hypothetical protein